MDLNAVAQDLFDELKSRYAKLTLGDDQAQVTSDPAQARFFKFNWNNNPVSVSIDEENLRLIYKNVNRNRKYFNDQIQILNGDQNFLSIFLKQ